MSEHEAHLRDAVALAQDNVAEGGSPYGAVIVKDGVVLARTVNTIHRTNDPTDHAEMVALREASRRLGSRDLAGCVVYASGQPCPMCHAAMRLSGIREGYFGYTAEEADRYGMATAGIYAELCKPLEEQPMRLRQIRPDDREPPYAAWREQRNKS
ncbi:nucleoside deaminase [Methylobacterium soli]|uniref:Nucleoside deaminase n=1 Tax=Methylobacterium soli TaxID=553447 RepID=A0A6L3T6S2_9HYPH|nr:nucleoside deaminase [Methylobacterium soli]KAB1081162.1 nucleoside deaminase [Methylobacterium soli]GJE43921.1 Guanine deaminase [Methylobacterium soli]